MISSLSFRVNKRKIIVFILGFNRIVPYNTLVIFADRRTSIPVCAVCLNSKLAEKWKCESINFKQVESNLPLRICSDWKLSCPAKNRFDKQTKFLKQRTALSSYGTLNNILHKKKLYSVAELTERILGVGEESLSKIKGCFLFFSKLC